MGHNDDLVAIREDSFLSELVTQAAERIAARHAGAYDESGSSQRFAAWLDAHTRKPAVIGRVSTMDHDLVQRLRGEVSDRLAQQRRMDLASCLPPMSAEDERQFARALIAQSLENYARTEIMAGRPPLTAQKEEELAEAVHAALFGVGRLQELLEDQEIENIDINGYDRYS